MYLTDFQKDIVKRLVDEDNFSIHDVIREFLNRKKCWITFYKSKCTFHFIWSDQKNSFTLVRDNMGGFYHISSDRSPDQIQKIQIRDVPLDSNEDSEDEKCFKITQCDEERYNSNREAEEFKQKKSLQQLHEIVSTINHLMKKLENENLIISVDHPVFSTKDIIGFNNSEGLMSSEIHLWNEPLLKSLGEHLVHVYEISMVKMPELSAFFDNGFLTEEELFKKKEASHTRFQSRMALVAVVVTVMLSLVTSIINLKSPTPQTRAIEVLNTRIEKLSDEINTLNGINF